MHGSGPVLASVQRTFALAAPLGFAGQRLAGELHSLVRVSRRVG